MAPKPRALVFLGGHSHSAPWPALSGNAAAADLRPTLPSRGAGRAATVYSALTLLVLDGALAQGLPQNSAALAADDLGRFACGPQWYRLGAFSCERDGSKRQTICGCRPPRFDDSTAWTNLGVIDDKECYTHVTGVSCGDTNPFRKGISACSANWEISGGFTCDDSRMEHQTICECSPPGADNPALWIKEGGDCYSHVTGRSCGKLSARLCARA